jgi:transcriptional regulator with XRE-family HTH domain
MATTVPLKDLPVALSDERKAKRVTMEDLAGKLGISVRALARWVNEKDHMVRLRDFERLAAILGCEVIVTLRPKQPRDTSLSRFGRE